MQLRQGTSLQGNRFQYRIERVLGQGGFGITYLATTSLQVEGPLGVIETKVNVAIKEFFMKDFCNRDENKSRVSVPSVGSREMVGRYRDKFIKEAKNIAKLKHPHIVKVIEVFEENGTAYYVMEYIEGCSLLEWVRDKGPLPEKEALGYIRQVASALDYIHSLQINHLDVKPGNILRRSSSLVVLIDFGMSKQYDASGEQTSSTPVGVSAGYAPIEQSTPNGVSQFSAPTDIYSLGATLYKLLTGNTPPDTTSIINDGLPPLPPHITPSTAATITKAMTPAKRNRPQTIQSFLQLLGGESEYTKPVEIEVEVEIEIEVEIEEEPTPSAPSPPPNNIPKKKKRNLKSLWLGLGVVVAILLFVIYLLLLPPLKYDMVSDFSEGLARVYVYSNGQYKYGFIDKSGHEVVPLKYDRANHFFEGMAAVKLNGKWGYIDKSGHEVIPLKYNEGERHWPDYWADNFSEGLVAVELNGKWGYIDKSGHEMIPLKYDRVGDFSEGLAAVRLGAKWCFIDKSGREVIPLKYDKVGKFSEGIAAVELNGKWGYIDKSIHEVAPLKYNNAGDFSEGIAAVELNGKWGYIDKSGLEVTPLKYNKAGDFSEGMAAVELNEKWGYIDKSGHEVIPLKYDRAGNFSEGMAVAELKKLTMLGWGRCYIHIDKSGKEVNVKLNGQGYEIGTSGKGSPPLHDGKDSIPGSVGITEPIGKGDKIDTVIPLKYDEVRSFSEGLAAVRLNNKFGFIDKNGKEVIPLKYDEARRFSEGLAAVRINNKYGYINKSGKEMISLKYDMANDFSGGKAKVKLNGRELWIDKNGKDAISLKPGKATNNYTGAYKYSTTFDNPIMEVPLRNAPNVNSVEIYRYPKNAIVYVIDDSGDVYCKAYVDGHTGYLSKRFLKIKK